MTVSTTSPRVVARQAATRERIVEAAWAVADELGLEGLSLRMGEAAPLRLTKLEARLLQILIANVGHVVGTERLLVHVWGQRGSGDRQLLKQLVHRLRHKIEPDPAQPSYLMTEAGAGYRLQVDGTQR